MIEESTPAVEIPPLSRWGWVGRIGRVVVVVALLGLIGFGLTMCVIDSMSPTKEAPILALYREDGVVYVETAACERDAVLALYVDSIDVDGRWVVARAGRFAVASTFRLFEAPPGWETGGFGTLRKRPALVPGGRYEIWLETNLNDQASLTLEPSQLDGTSHERVLASSGRDDPSVGAPIAAPMPRDAFDARAGRYCAKNHPS